MDKRPNTLFQQLNHFEAEIKRLEAKIQQLEDKLETQSSLARNHLIRVKNREQISDEFILSGRSYHDLSPEKAWKQYSNPDFDFIFIDISETIKPENKIKEAIHIPWSEFKSRFYEISHHSTPILIISEDGTSSVLACEFMAKNGYFNCNNISGGHKFWPGHRIQNLKSA